MEEGQKIHGDHNVRASVCMATFNGSAHVLDQMRSILVQLGPNDELVVVDDASSDSTVEAIASLRDDRIRLLKSPINRGYVKTFETALTASRGQYIFLSDQDDLWIPGRLNLMLDALATSPVIASNFSFFGQAPRRIESLRLKAKDSPRRWANLLLLWIGVRPYYGCAMAFRRDIATVILPFPTFLTETHDQWIAMVGNLHNGMRHLEENTLSRRLHDSNTTPKGTRPALLILRSRVMLGRAFIVAIQRTRKYRREGVR